MNKTRRKALNAVIKKLYLLGEIRAEILAELEGIQYDEQEAFDNLPESFQEGERGEAMQEVIDGMQEVLDALDEFDTDDLTTQLETIIEA